MAHTSRRALSPALSRYGREGGGPGSGAETHVHVFTYIDESLWERLRNSDYAPDSVIGKFVGIAIEDVQDLRQLDATIRRPAGNNTLRRWQEVFG